MSMSLPQHSLFNFDTPFATGSSGMSNSQAPATPVETLSISDLMKNPHVQSMYNSYQEMANQVLQGAQLQQNLWQEKQNLWQENCRLSAEVRALQVNQSQSRGRDAATPTPNQCITYFITLDKLKPC